MSRPRALKDRLFSERNGWGGGQYERKMQIVRDDDRLSPLVCALPNLRHGQRRCQEKWVGTYLRGQFWGDGRMSWELNMSQVWWRRFWHSERGEVFVLGWIRPKGCWKNSWWLFDDRANAERQGIRMSWLWIGRRGRWRAGNVRRGRRVQQGRTSRLLRPLRVLCKANTVYKLIAGVQGLWLAEQSGPHGMSEPHGCEIPRAANTGDFMGHGTPNSQSSYSSSRWGLAYCTRFG